MFEENMCRVLYEIIYELPFNSRAVWNVRVSLCFHTSVTKIQGVKYVRYFVFILSYARDENMRIAAIVRVFRG